MPSVTASLMPPGWIQSEEKEVDLPLVVLFIFLLSLENWWIPNSWLSNCSSEQARLELKCFPMVLCQTGVWQRNWPANAFFGEIMLFWFRTFLYGAGKSSMLLLFDFLLFDFFLFDFLFFDFFLFLAVLAFFCLSLWI